MLNFTKQNITKIYDIRGFNVSRISEILVHSIFDLEKPKNGIHEFVNANLKKFSNRTTPKTQFAIC